MNEASGPTDTPEFPDVPAFVSVLNRHGVRYVVIGGYVAQGFISDYVTHDVDFTPSTDRENLDRLSAALSELGARIRTDAVSEGLPFAHNGASLMRAKMWNLQCALGEFDITFEPAGGGYDHLAPRAHVITVRGVDIPLADLADVVASKRLANRVKDQLVLPRLDQALAERDKAIEVDREGPVPPSTD